jgi:hypothetical protein
MKAAELLPDRLCEPSPRAGCKETEVLLEALIHVYAKSLL